MQKKSSLNYFLYLLLIAFGITITIAGTVHLIISFYDALTLHHLYYINLIRILGISTLWPKYQSSNMATILSWVVTTIIYTSILALFVKRYDPKIMFRLKENVKYNKETKRLTYETKSAKEIEVIPLTKLIEQLYRLKDLVYKVDA